MRRERDQWLRHVEWKQAPFQPEPEHEHQREGDQEDNPLLTPAQPEMSGPRHEPGNGAEQISQ